MKLNIKKFKSKAKYGWVLIFLLSAFPFSVLAQKATWIWYPGDYEIWLGNQMQNRRTDRGSFFPVFWKMDSHYVLMDFHKTCTLQEPENVSIYAEGKYNVKVDGNLIEGTPCMIRLPAGLHRIDIKV